MRKPIALLSCLMLGVLILSGPSAFAQSSRSGNNAAGANGNGSNNTNITAPAYSADADGNDATDGKYGGYRTHRHERYDNSPRYDHVSHSDAFGRSVNDEGVSTAAPMSGPNR